MSVISNAPLIEAWFELKWGKVAPSFDPNIINLSFEDTDTVFFPGLFRKEAASHGYTVVTPRSTPSGLPHMVSHKFTNPNNENTLLQIGTGIFSANHLSKGYDWPLFKELIIEGIDIFKKSHPQSDSLPIISAELRYQDVLLYTEGERSIDVLKNKTNLHFKLPEAVWEMPSLNKASLEAKAFVFNIGIEKPKANLGMEFLDAIVNGAPGLLVNMVVSCTPKDHGEFSLDESKLSDWLEAAHETHRHIFKSMIQVGAL